MFPPEPEKPKTRYKLEMRYTVMVPEEHTEVVEVSAEDEDEAESQAWDEIFDKEDCEDLEDQRCTVLSALPDVPGAEDDQTLPLFPEPVKK